ncbi:MAG: 6,7-dimethyl-8-ribityllumazine synthase [Candidatus Methylomirabilis sp.]|nr:6,7-dimethyl-8-ribityllumazine synthase [Deltaproteobacteria bacterium]
MAKVIEGDLSAAGLRFALVVSRFNHFVVDRLREGALDCIARHGGDAEAAEVFLVPGAFDMPLAVRKVCETGRFDAVVALGAVIRGGTPHFEYVSAEAVKGVAGAALATGVPVALGILTCDTIEQAIERAGAKAGNKGWEAAIAAVEMARLLKKIG